VNPIPIAIAIAIAIAIVIATAIAIAIAGAEPGRLGLRRWSFHLVGSSPLLALLLQERSQLVG